MKIHARRLPRIRLSRFGIGRRLGAVVFALMLVCLPLSVAVLIDAQIKPVVRRYAYSRAVSLATSTVNGAVCETLEQSGVKYQDLVHLMTNESGAVTALTANSVEINKLKAKILTNVVNRLEQLENTRLSIPFGTVSGVDILSGVGPMIRFTVVPLSSAQAEFASSFSAAGINQTIHKISMTVYADISILLPGDSVNARIETQVDVAETVIVGTVPDSYTKVEDVTGGELTDEIYNFSN